MKSHKELKVMEVTIERLEKELKKVKNKEYQII